ncbi:MAG: thioredoxin family protein [Candidatus Heimdallarchaeota archaeon]
MSVKELGIGSPAPNFSLPGVDGSEYSLESFANKKILVIIFSCNHCPYVRAYEDRMVALQRDYVTKGVALVAINSNETKNYPTDSFEHMVERAEEKGFNFPYLRDETQAIADAYGAERTPHLFVFDESRALRYIGAIDDNWKEPKKARIHYLRDALDALLEGRAIAEPETYAIGCTIKWES